MSKSGSELPQEGLDVCSAKTAGQGGGSTARRSLLSARVYAGAGSMDAVTEVLNSSPTFCTPDM